MRIALIGASGQLGADLHSLLGDAAVPLTHGDIEITDSDNVYDVLSGIVPDVVINAAAYNHVDQAEAEPDRAYRVNGLGPRILARYCGEHDIVLLHVSTDYVFGMDPHHTEPYREVDLPGPVNAYGASKLAGEYFVRNLCQRHFVVRTCGLYGHAVLYGSSKSNFVETMLRLARQQSELKVVADQRCTPTATADLARALSALIRTETYGLYHATNSDDATWFEFAREIVRLARLDASVVPTTSEEFGSKAPRPRYSVLDCRSLTEVIGFPMPSWHDALRRYLAASK